MVPATPVTLSGTYDYVTVTTPPFAAPASNAYYQIKLTATNSAKLAGSADAVAAYPEPACADVAAVISTAPTTTTGTTAFSFNLSPPSTGKTVHYELGVFCAGKDGVKLSDDDCAAATVTPPTTAITFPDGADADTALPVDVEEPYAATVTVTPKKNGGVKFFFSVAVAAAATLPHKACAPIELRADAVSLFVFVGML